MRHLLMTVIVCLVPSIAAAGVSEVSVTLPVRPRLAFEKDTAVAVAPFVIVVSAEDRNNRAAKVDVQGEFARFITKKLRKDTELQIISAIQERLPTSDLKALAANKDLWRGIAARAGADYVLTGSIDFDIEDKSGYRTEEFVSPVDGRTYYRQVLIESTGFVFDIVLMLFDGATGEKVIEENLRDFRQFDARDYDELTGLFENLRSLERQILGVFVSQETTSTRYLFD